MSANTSFLAFERHLKRATGESVATMEAAYNPWETELDAMDERLGFKEPDAVEPDDTDSQTVVLAAKGLSELFLFCFHGNKLDARGVGLQKAIRRFVAVAHDLGGKFMCHGESEGKLKGGGPPLTAKELARLPDVKTTPKQLRKLAKDFRQQWLGAPTQKPKAKAKRPTKHQNGHRR
jgi:hypothetical protein